MHAHPTPPLPLPPVASILDGRHLVVTGVTGFVGKVWLAHLLTHVPTLGRVTVLVRGGRRGALARMASILDTNPCFRPLREAVQGDLADWLADRLEVLDADLTQPMCGLDEATVDRLSQTADAMVHIAGNTTFQADPRKGIPANVDGTRHVAELVRRFRHPRLVHMSTCYVAGLDDGETPERLVPGVSPHGTAFDVDAEIDHAHRVIGELDDAQARIDALADRARTLGWPNLYTYSKALAEHWLATTDLDVTIVRPSVVESARSFPFPAWNEGLNTSGPIMWFCGTVFPALPATAGHRFDVVPVDAVARWTTVVLARHLVGQARDVYQFASSDVNPATFDRIVELTALGKRRHARRPGATAVEKALARLDVVPRRHDDAPLLTPATAGRVLNGLLDLVGSADRRRRTLPSGLATSLGAPLKKARHRLRQGRRTLSRLETMLEHYRPFIHDHDWCFHSGRIRAEVAALDPVDHHVFGDDLTTMCWRTYWLDVQYEAMVRWAFPILDGRPVPHDPPSDPPLALRDPAEALSEVAV